jgi:hypothetical protein
LREFENRVLKRIFRCKRVEVTGGWRKLCSEKLHDLYSSPSIIAMTISRRMKWTAHITSMCTQFWLESLKGRHHLEDLG